MDTVTLTKTIDAMGHELALARMATNGLQHIMCEMFTAANPATDAVAALIDRVADQLDRIDNLHGAAERAARAA